MKCNEFYFSFFLTNCLRVLSFQKKNMYFFLCYSNDVMWWSTKGFFSAHYPTLTSRSIPRVQHTRQRDSYDFTGQTAPSPVSRRGTVRHMCCRKRFRLQFVLLACFTYN
jgi:hypothetical protein